MIYKTITEEIKETGQTIKELLKFGSREQIDGNKNKTERIQISESFCKIPQVILRAHGCNTH